MNQKMLIVIAACVALIGASEVSGSEDEWNKNYEIVGSSGATVADSKMMAALMSLEKDASAGQVDPKLAEKVHFWSNALSNIEFGDCTEQHLNELRHEAGNNNRLVELAQRTFLELCSVYHSDLNKKMSTCLHDELPFVRKIQTSFDYYLMNKRDLGTFIKLAKEIAGVKGSVSKDKLMPAWRNGFCKRMLVKMDMEQQMVYHSRFVELVTRLGRSQIDYTAEPVRSWIRVLDMCQRLDCIVRNHVYKGSCTVRAHRA